MNKSKEEGNYYKTESYGQPLQPDSWNNITNKLGDFS